ncbi:MAG TPA: T9SS type A sorting domain-containing protein [Bacteroidia bacterium]|nr:T9SS type A sorting domain-containing protein [Bacteroidia bacterium]
MKKLYTLIIIFMYSLSCKAQSYYPMLDSAVNIWYYTFNIFPVSPINSPVNGLPCFYGGFGFSPSVKHYTQGDTVINSLNYHQLMFDNYFSTGGCTYGYLREDTASKKIYFMDNVFSPEILLYDFSMQVGSTISLNFLFPNYWQNGVYTVDSIVVKPFTAGNRNVFYLSCHTCTGSMPLIWVESIGNQGDLIYTHSANFQSFGYFSSCATTFPMQFPYDFVQILTCFEHIPKIYLDSCCLQIAMTNSCLQFADSCNYWNICGSVKELGFVKSFAVSPNPAKEEITLTIESDKKTEADFILRDIAGKEIMISKSNMILPGNKSVRLNIMHIENGIYIIECRMKEGSLYRKLVAE